MLQGEHSAKLLTLIKLPFVIKIFILSIFEWPFYTGFTVNVFNYALLFGGLMLEEPFNGSVLNYRGKYSGLFLNSGLHGRSASKY